MTTKQPIPTPPLSHRRIPTIIHLSAAAWAMANQCAEAAHQSRSRWIESLILKQPAK